MSHRYQILFASAALFVLPLFHGCGHEGPSVTAPSSYETYVSKDKMFKIDYPASWDLKDGLTETGRAWVKFTSGSAEISVSADVAGSLLADMTLSENQIQGGKPDKDREPIAVVHNDASGAFEDRLGVEEDEPTVVKSGMGEGRKSEFEGEKSFGSPIHGYRATFLSLKRCIQVVCRCSEADWETLKPAFEKVIASVGRASTN
jgi:hypothetical protein